MIAQLRLALEVARQTPGFVNHHGHQVAGLCLNQKYERRKKRKLMVHHQIPWKKKRPKSLKRLYIIGKVWKIHPSSERPEKTGTTPQKTSASAKDACSAS
jgi:hypothetical protein